MLGKIEGRRRRGRQRMRWLDGITGSMDWVWVNSRSWWWTERPGVLQSMGSQSQIWLSDWTELNWIILSDIFLRVGQLCPTLYDLMDYTVHGILRARILKWVALPFSRVSSEPRDQTQVSHIAGRFFTSWTIREAHSQILDTVFKKANQCLQ